MILYVILQYFYFSMSMKSKMGFSIGIVMKLSVAFVKMVMFIILIHKMQEDETYFHFQVSLL